MINEYEFLMFAKQKQEKERTQSKTLESSSTSSYKNKVINLFERRRNSRKLKPCCVECC
ncbi:hypothetical protein BCAH820_B0287 (plasmid) [Bacillus cereus AH820]|uniref:Uncharacterized protein n=1 Tax=Bacillus cereus (strain AH820) TaxID=405535 RepID=B7JU35_BACC0|nr:hypothetical protein BCAH820_B0287 [Bacillus cereus AH820]BCT42245.1 hypothetical protein WHT_55200 [Bacillus cereus]SCN02992.1 Uncharacterized protein BCF24048_05589 [Bacillus cereus]